MADEHGENLEPETSQPEVSTLIRVFGPTVGSILLFLIEAAQIIVVALVIIFVVRGYLLMPFSIKGASMEPTFSDREYVLVDRISYRFSEPERGDVVVFRYPRNLKEFFIKRIVGMPGDTVEVRDGRVIVYNRDTDSGPVALEEAYVGFAHTSGDLSVTLNPDEYFVLGDNRGASLDSRNFGPVKLQKHVIGRVFFRGLPLKELGPIANDVIYNL